MAIKAAKLQTLRVGVVLAAEHAAKRQELSAKLTKPQANKVMQAIGKSYGFERVPYALAVGEFRDLWAKEYAASLKRKQPVTQRVKPSVAKPKARTRKAAKPQAEAKVEVEATAAPTEPVQDDRVASLEAKVDKLADMFAEFMKATK